MSIEARLRRAERALPSRHCYITFMKQGENETDEEFHSRAAKVREEHPRAVILGFMEWRPPGWRPEQ
jgi:hypothetical protein